MRMWGRNTLHWKTWCGPEKRYWRKYGIIAQRRGEFERPYINCYETFSKSELKEVKFGL